MLVAAFEVSHPRHTVCLPWLQQAQTEQIQGLIATHTLAEVYSVLTRLPVCCIETEGKFEVFGISHSGLRITTGLRF